MTAPTALFVVQSLPSTALFVAESLRQTYGAVLVCMNTCVGILCWELLCVFQCARVFCVFGVCTLSVSSLVC